MKIFYKSEYRIALNQLAEKDKEIDKIKLDHQKEINDLKYQYELKNNGEYDPNNDPIVLKNQIETLKNNYKIEIESLKNEILDLKKELKEVKKENKLLIKDKAKNLTFKTEDNKKAKLSSKINGLKK